MINSGPLLEKTSHLLIMLVCHDLKFEIDPVAPPLPSGLRVVPMLFYAAIVGCAFFAAYFTIQKNASERARLAQDRITAEEKKKIAQVQIKQTELEADIKRANSMIDWVAGSDPIQKLTMIINNSVYDDTTINSLKLTRRPESPWQIQMSLRLNADNPSDLDATLEKLEEAKYRRYSPQRRGTGCDAGHSRAVFQGIPGFYMFVNDCGVCT